MAPESRPHPRILVVELRPELVAELSTRLAGAAAVSSAEAAGIVEKLVAEPPDLAVLNLELSQGSGFGFVNRVARMEALAGLKVMVVGENTSDAAIEAHKQGPTPAAAYARRHDGVSDAAFADEIAAVACRTLGIALPAGDALPEAAEADLVEVPPTSPSLDVIPPATSTSWSDAASSDPAKSSSSSIDLAAIIESLGYRVLRRLRDEDSGAVFACKDDELGRVVAIKLMAPQGQGDADRERWLRFQRERRILALMQSPYVVSVYGAGSVQDVPYLVREFVDGESLQSVVARDGALDVVTALKYVRDAARGLRHAAGAGVIHRDVRPANIHVVDGQAKLAGFGMGRRESPDEARITSAGLPLRDLTYVAPERVRGDEDLRGDIYAVGVTLHTLVAGAPPFTKAAPLDLLTGRVLEKPRALDEHRPGTPSKVVSLAASMMAENPADRPQTYDDVLSLIDEALKGLQQSLESSWVSSTSPTQPPTQSGPGTREEPTAVHGTLRLMGVTEIVQSLELARKTATVTLSFADDPDGKLIFEAGKLVFAEAGDEAGDAAFFTLVTRKKGAFRVDYEPVHVEPNVTTPTTGLLLEAARRADTGSGASLTSTQPGTPDTSPQTGAFMTPTEDELRASVAAAKRADAAAAAANEALDPEDARALKAARFIPAAWGFAVIVVVTGLAVYGAFQTPAILLTPPVDDNTADLAIPALLEKTRARSQKAEAALAEVKPQLASMQEAQAASATATEEAKKRAGELKTNVATALSPELAAKKLTLRMSDDGAEVIVEIGEGALFTGDSDDVSVDGKTALARIAGAFATINNVRIRVEGHTDDTDPPKRHRNNWSFTGARAINVAKVLTEQGLASARVKPVALAETQPVVLSKVPRARAHNRRVELHLVPM